MHKTLYLSTLLLLSPAGCQFGPIDVDSDDDEGATTGDPSDPGDPGDPTPPSTTGAMSPPDMAGSTDDGESSDSDSDGPPPPRCGDGVLNPGEECDEGLDNDDAGACKSDCTLQVCGDGFVGGPEACDDGNDVDDDECSNACVPASCGDGVVNGGEQCDDGPANDDAGACQSDCTLQECGDGFIGPDEQCDDGNAVDDDYCTNACVEATCGDGHINGDEQCDDGPANDDTGGCKSDCTLQECGDGFNGPREGCDDGNDIDDDYCTNACIPATCGDALVNGDEGCDDGNADDGDGCPTTCEPAECGDGFTWDGIEACDDGNASNDDGCTNACALAVCGDGLVWDGVEECDDGGESAACDVDCTEPACGDGLVNAAAGEQCDDGNGDDNDGCPSTCQIASCGDGYVQDGVEECDDGGESAACDADCSAAVCGDGTLNAAAGEACDDGNLVDGDGCSGQCVVEGYEDLRPNVLLCGNSSRDVTSFFPAGSGLNLVSSCTPDGDTQAILISRTGTGSYDPAELSAYVNAGGLVLTEFSSSDEVFSDLFEDVAQGAFTGSCYDRAPIAYQYSPDDRFWTDNAFNAIALGETGCGMNVAAYPGITPLAGWNDTAVSIAYRDLGAGRMWVIDFDWQDNEVPEDDPSYADTNHLMGYMITTRPETCGNPGGGPLTALNGTGTGVLYCYAEGDSIEARAQKACESHFGIGNCCVIPGGYNGEQYGECGQGGGAGTYHWHPDSHPNGHCGPFYVVGDVIAPGWCGVVTGSFL